MTSKTFKLTISSNPDTQEPVLGINERGVDLQETPVDENDLSNPASFILSQTKATFREVKPRFSLGKVELLQQIELPMIGVALSFEGGEAALRFFNLTKTIGPVLHPATQDILMLATYTFKEPKIIKGLQGLRSFRAQPRVESRPDSYIHSLEVTIDATPEPYTFEFVSQVPKSFKFHQFDLSEVIRI